MNAWLQLLGLYVAVTTPVIAAVVWIVKEFYSFKLKIVEQQADALRAENAALRVRVMPITDAEAPSPEGDRPAQWIRN